MFSKKAQVATEYIIITAFILITVTIIFTYSYLDNNQKIVISQANNALDKLVNKADFVYALGPDNIQFVDVTLGRGIVEDSIRDITVCDNGTTIWSEHYGFEDESCGNPEYVKGGAIEMQIRLFGDTSTIRSSTKAEIEMDYPLPYSGFPTDEGFYRARIYWCGEKICLSKDTEAFCGDNACEPGDCSRGCTTDCTIEQCCGNGSWDELMGENCSNCEADCVSPEPECGANGCEPGESYANCREDCCEADCTDAGDMTCHSDCDTYNGCSFTTGCDGSGTGTQVCSDVDSYFSCCSGSIIIDCPLDQYCSGGLCLDCSTVCDGVCQSIVCYGTDPDCDYLGGTTEVCCGDGDCTGNESNPYSPDYCWVDCFG